MSEDFVDEFKDIFKSIIKRYKNSKLHRDATLKLCEEDRLDEVENKTLD